MKNYYEILGVSADSDEGVIKANYRKLAKKYHPDLHPGDKEAESRFKEIGQAWAVLGDPDRRAGYDAERAQKKSASNKKSSVPKSKIDYTEMMNQFDTFFGKTAPPGRAKPVKNPLDASELFERYMGKGYK